LLYDPLLKHGNSEDKWQLFIFASVSIPKAYFYDINFSLKSHIISN
jgi:hypothetical protein